MRILDDIWALLTAHIINNVNYYSIILNKSITYLNVDNEIRMFLLKVEDQDTRV